MKVKFNHGPAKLLVVKCLFVNLNIGLKEARDYADNQEFECSPEQYPTVKEALEEAGATGVHVAENKKGAWCEEDEKNLEGITLFLSSTADLEDPETWIEWIKTFKTRLQSCYIQE